MMRHCCSVILLLAVQVCTAPAQQYLFKNYTANDGLVANAVRHIFQDKKGFMWIGTVEGLSKYDGHRFTNYTTVNGLTDYIINAFYETNDGTLYIAPNDGSVVAAAEHKLILSVKPSGPVINRFLKTPGGRIITTTDFNGLAEFSNNELFPVTQPFPHSSYVEITGLDDSLFMVVNDSSLQVFNYRYELFSMVKENSAKFVDYKLFKDSQKRIWAGAYQGLKQIRWPVKKGEPLSFIPLPRAFDIPELKQNIITAIFEDNKQTLWVGTNKGLVKINRDASHQVLTKKDGLADDYVSCIFQDREMNLWFGTLGGVSKLVTTSGITIYTTQNGIASDQLGFVSRFDKDNLLIYSTGGLQTFNKKTEKAYDVPNPSKLAFYDKVVNSSPQLLMAGGQITSIDTVTHVITNINSTGSNFYSSAIADSNNNFFLYGTGGLFFTDRKKLPEKVLDQNTPSAQIDRNGFLWAGTWWYGLYRFKYSVSDGSIHIQSKEHYLPNERFRCIFMDSHGNIWAGTRQHGVYIFKDGDPGDYTILNQSKGLMSDFVKKITEDKEGNIWLVYFQGLDKLTKKGGGYSIFNFSKVNNFYPVTNSMEYDGDSSIWLATTDGLVKINDSRADKMPPLPVYITKISSPDSVYPLSAAKLRLSYRQNKLMFEYSSPGFINEKQILYSYRLAGGETNEWSLPSSEHSVSFASLRTGTYTFEVRPQGWNGQWGTTASFSFEILPPFWQTWWFRILCALLVTCLTVWLVKRRIKYIRHESELKHKMAEAEMAALRSQMNPHFIFNCLNAIDNLIQTNQKDKATAYLSRFAKLIRNVLDSSKNNAVPFQKDYESLQLYLQMEQFRCSNRFEYELKAEEELLHGDYKVPPLIVQPFVENAIHHGLLNKETGERKLTVSAQLNDDSVLYTITDNGIGREKAKQLKLINKPEHESYGISITEERIQLYNQGGKGANDVNITDLYENGQPCGTKAVIRIKIDDNN